MRGRQGGMSLVGLMVGLLISVLVMLVLMTSLRTFSSIGTQARREANQDGELATALVSLQMDIQGAGYGMAAGAGEALAVARLALDGQAEPREALLWRFRDGALPTCGGLVERAGRDAESGQPLRILSRLRAPDCSLGTGLASLAWAPAEDLLLFRNRSESQLRIELAEEVCSPFGAIGEARRHPTVTLSAPSSTQQAGADVPPVSYRICLLNLPASDA
ncbi:hypothetical protein SAMN05216189_100587 [Pseudomonas delhiensis]|uniref:Uncharacterized protein n=2 Tax=Pseudomonas delhiensis TaxID=366289 RepID=A0A239HUV9_9PSED|nr:hypothetical protein [Pseudomonas delhiensis]SDI44891.1 hypothetical protein SAMN05216189_100587 [Pseudomonas delhiensis]SNS85061.1 hypothetical protein SAMN06295949_108101 [Pseudomonas delhiensis]